MSIRMHDYGNGTTGLAAFCDTCNEQITDGDGWIVWNSNDVKTWILVHQRRCDPGCQPGGKREWGFSMPFDAEWVYLANSAGIDIDKAREHAGDLSMI